MVAGIIERKSQGPISYGKAGCGSRTIERDGSSGDPTRCAWQLVALIGEARTTMRQPASLGLRSPEGLQRAFEGAAHEVQGIHGDARQIWGPTAGEVVFPPMDPLVIGHRHVRLAGREVLRGACGIGKRPHS
jgi:hypothetical protein